MVYYPNCSEQSDPRTLAAAPLGRLPAGQLGNTPAYLEMGH
jgi:hypothetical protein